MQFKFTTAGESHGKALIAIVEGLPAGLEIDIAAINHELWRRQQGYGRGGRMKIESDKAEILSGIRHGKTLGSPVAIMIENKDFVHWQDVMAIEPRVSSPTVREGASLQKAALSKSDKDTKNAREVTRPRPGHADLAGGQKFQARDLRNILERASARETAARVAVGALAKQLLAQFGIEIKSHVIKLGNVPDTPLDKTWDEIAAIEFNASLLTKEGWPKAGVVLSALNCADEDAEKAMIALIDIAKENGDTLGGIFEVVARDVVTGLGSHTSWNEKLDGRIGQAFMSIHAVKAVEIGTGVDNASRFGSEVHDEIFWSEPGSPPVLGGVDAASADGVVGAGGGQSGNSSNGPPANAGGDRFYRRTNRAGGLEGGITNGEELRIRGYLKPISTLRKPLHSVDINTKEETDAAFERSDITVVPAAGVIGEAMLAIVLANSMREKFGGDSMDEMKRNFDAYVQSLIAY